MTTSKGSRRKGFLHSKGLSRHSRRLYVWAHIIDVGLDPDEVIEGMIEIKTERGQSVNVIAKGQYEIVQTGEMLASDDPKALG